MGFLVGESLGCACRAGSDSGISPRLSFEGLDMGWCRVLQCYNGSVLCGSPKGQYGPSVPLDGHLHAARCGVRPACRCGKYPPDIFAYLDGSGDWCFRMVGLHQRPLAQPYLRDTKRYMDDMGAVLLRLRTALGTTDWVHQQSTCQSTSVWCFQIASAQPR
jgi:hypothetical protein